MPGECDFPRERTYSIMHRAALLIRTPLGDFFSQMSDPPPPVFNFPFELERFRYIVTSPRLDLDPGQSDLGEFVNGVYNGVPLPMWEVYELRPSAEDAGAYDEEHGRWWIKEGYLVPPPGENV
jgi:hypothetical protein